MTESRLPTGLELGLGSYGSPLRVLVIGSSNYTPDMIKEVGEAGGLGVDVARDPRDAIQRMQDQFYEVVVVDLPNPQMTAEGLYTYIGEVNPEQAERVVFLANDLNDPSTLRFLTEAKRPFLTQPVDPHQVYDLMMRVGLAEVGD